MLYGVLFLVSGAGLLALTNLLVATNLPMESRIVSGTAAPGQLPPSPSYLQSQAVRQRSVALEDLLVQSGIALAVMTVLSIGLGWVVAGRVLRPLRTITAAAQHTSASNLHERLALTGPDDELKELADTFDAFLARLEGAFDAQRQFVANASHELRTPLARQRTLIEVALADPQSSVASLQAACGRALAASEQQERLIDALLTLAHTQRGLARPGAHRRGRGDPRRGGGPPGRRRCGPASRFRPTWDPRRRPVTRGWPNGWPPTWSATLSSTTSRAAGSAPAPGSRRTAPCSPVANSGPVVPPAQVGGCSSRSSGSARTGSPARAAAAWDCPS